MAIGFFNLPITSTATPEIWVRPSDWVDISTISTNQINLLAGDFSTASIQFL